jgi:hypothetical protein
MQNVESDDSHFVIGTLFSTVARSRDCICLDESDGVDIPESEIQSEIETENSCFTNLSCPFEIASDLWGLFAEYQDRITDLLSDHHHILETAFQFL